MPGPYQIISQIGKSGMSAIYKAYHAASKFHPAKNAGLVTANLRKKIWSGLRSVSVFFEKVLPITSQN
jgi:hypothetical protein